MKRAGLLVFSLLAAACGGKVVVDQNSGGGSTSGATFACGDQLCQRDTELCVDVPPVQPPPQGDGVEAFHCVALPVTCSVPPTCACVGNPTDCTFGVASCSVDADGAMTAICQPE
jgi:hypothetical protein